MKTKYIILVCSILVVIAFFVGQATVSTIPEIEYVKGEEIAGSVPTGQLVPVREVMPEFSFLPYRLLIINGKETQVTDTAVIIADYEKRREYSLTAFDDKEKGKLELYPTVQYNSLQSIDWKFTPVSKVITRIKKPVFQPFLSAGWSTLNYVSVGAGMFYHDFGVEYQYLKGYNGMSDGHMVGVKWKF
ncbi:hypothetical protein [Bacteroides sp. 51]|uniref:hypothetical protein n=1 Tax=Bacteroides sp. 51 TaxID=2302938 RepID=UPI0013D64D29|nr:hypothetical protein [Bacteroides sp. 51]NDV81317.1 hypothetical protein [Bacteroides sp. 51]